MNERRTLTPQEIDGIEKNASTKIHEKLLHELKNNPSSFDAFKSLEKTESNVYYLAKDYLDNVQKSLVPQNEEIQEIAERFVSDTSTYDTIKQLANDVAIKNKRLVKTLIETVKDCVDSAYQLAIHREKTRLDADNESIKESLARIERELANARRERENGSNLSTNAISETTIPSPTHAHNISPPNAAAAEQKETVQTRQPSKLPPPFTFTPAVNLQKQYSCSCLPKEPLQKSPSVTNARKRTRTSFPPTAAKQQRHDSPMQQFANSHSINPQLGRYHFVSEEECRRLRASNQYADQFIRAYLPKLYTPAELLLPLKDLPVAKKIEFLFVLTHLYGPSFTWEQEFTLAMEKIRRNKRTEIFKAIGKTKGYGITSNGKCYYYKLSTRMCFSNYECAPSSNLRTKPLGIILIPEACKDFEYILLIEKETHLSKMQKLYANGKIERI